MCGVLVCLGCCCTLSPLSSAQEAGWQQQVRECLAAKDWTSALRIVDREQVAAPNDIDVKAWHARIMAASGEYASAEREYLAVISAQPNDPDYWLGLASVYSAEGRPALAVNALDHAVALDPGRDDLRLARARALNVAHPRSEPKHEVRYGVNTDLYDFAGANHDEELTLDSQWTSRWRTRFSADGYQRYGNHVGKFTTGVTARSPAWGAFTAGGSLGGHNEIIPRTEVFFDYDRGWRLSTHGLVRGLELSYGQHWYAYSTARILTLNQTTILYLPRDWVWTTRVTGAKSHFSGAGVEWRPSGMTRLAFPIATHWTSRLAGDLLFAVGTENFARIDQIGVFASQTYGGGLGFRLTPRQQLTGYAIYQRRTQGRTQIGFGFNHAIRF